MTSPASSPRRQQQSQPLGRSGLRARNALVLEHLPLADAIASATARRLFPLVEREELIQVAREALVRSAPCCRAGEPAAPYLRRCITGALQHHLRDRVRLVRISRREHEKCTWPLGHTSLDAPAAGESSLVEQQLQLRPQPSGSQSLRVCRSALQPNGSRSAPCRCSGPRRRPSPPCASSWRFNAAAEADT
jgi:DNA-directed RNA polymerase specialized sigma24 family protein